jgi:hypothetical protein
MVTDITPVAGISRRERGWINMDLEVSADGNRLYFTHSYFSGQPVPSKSNLALAVKDGSDFREAGNSWQIMAATNTGRLEYAPATSEDELTLYWTHAGSLEGGAGFEIRKATRADRNAPFGNVETLAIFTGHFEAPTVSPDGKMILYHKLVDGRFRIHAVARSGSE